jgi:hypothetical protein
MKKILSLLVALSLVLGCAFSASATVVTPSDVPDDLVQLAKDAYSAIEQALENGDYDVLMEKITELGDYSLEMDEEQQMEWQAYVEANIGYEKFLETVLIAGIVVAAAEVHKEFVKDKNAVNAYIYVTFFDELKASGMDMSKFSAEMIADYEDAKANYMPSQNVIDVLEAYEEMSFVLMWAMYDEDFTAACEGFEAVLDTFHELTEEELDVLAQLMDVEDREEAVNMILADWEKANQIDALGKAFTAFEKEANAETAAALVEAYDSVFGATATVTEEDLELYREFFPEIDDAYAKAKAMLNPSDEESKQEEQMQGSVVTGSDAAASKDIPKTGEDLYVPVAMTVMMVSAFAFVMLKRKRG